ncbi:MAG: FAD-binding oxidoreductase, partial [Propionicimonas sp.]|nr:FAD-binding oxidoreductase [Propionicimonas sp.]
TTAGTVLIGSSRQRVGFDDRLQVRVLAELARKAIALFPFLAGMNLLRSYTGFRPYLPDHLPVIGPDHRLPGLYHVTGHEGAGIGLSAISAELLAALVCDQPPVLDPAPFAVQRPSLEPHLVQDDR